MKKNILLGLLLVSIIFSSTTSIANQSNTNEIVISNELKLEIKESLTELGISELTQDNLIKKLEKGEIWDCMDKEKVSQIPEDYFAVSLENLVKRYVFPDGSVIEQKLEIPISSLISPFDISGGNTESGSGFYKSRGVKVSKKSGLLGMGFFADYLLLQNYPDQIDRIYDRWVKVVGGSYSVDTFKITRKVEDVSANKPATAKLIADVSYIGGITGSATDWIYLNVGGDKAWSSQN